MSEDYKRRYRHAVYTTWQLVDMHGRNAEFLLFQSLLTALGESTFRQKRSMKEAFLSGIYQMQLMGKIDLSAVQQLSSLINTAAPPLIAHAFRAFTANTIDDSLGCEREQAPLQMLMSPMGREYAEQLWGFQSALFFMRDSGFGMFQN